MENNYEDKRIEIVMNNLKLMESNEVIRKFILPKFFFENIYDYIDFLELNENIVDDQSGRG